MMNREKIKGLVKKVDIDKFKANSIKSKTNILFDNGVSIPFIEFNLDPEAVVGLEIEFVKSQPVISLKCIQAITYILKLNGLSNKHIKDIIRQIDSDNPDKIQEFLKEFILDLRNTNPTMNIKGLTVKNKAKFKNLIHSVYYNKGVFIPFSMKIEVLSYFYNQMKIADSRINTIFKESSKDWIKSVYEAYINKNISFNEVSLTTLISIIDEVVKVPKDKDQFVYLMLLFIHLENRVYRKIESYKKGIVLPSDYDIKDVFDFSDLSVMYKPSFIEKKEVEDFEKEYNPHQYFNSNLDESELCRYNYFRDPKVSKIANNAVIGFPHYKGALILELLLNGLNMEQINFFFKHLDEFETFSPYHFHKKVQTEENENKVYFSHKNIELIIYKTAFNKSKVVIDSINSFICEELNRTCNNDIFLQSVGIKRNEKYFYVDKKDNKIVKKPDTNKKELYDIYRSYKYEINNSYNTFLDRVYKNIDIDNLASISKKTISCFDDFRDVFEDHILKFPELFKTEGYTYYRDDIKFLNREFINTNQRPDINYPKYTRLSLIKNNNMEEVIFKQIKKGAYLKDDMKDDGKFNRWLENEERDYSRELNIENFKFTQEQKEALKRVYTLPKMFVLSGYAGTGKALAKDELVLTQKGFKPISEIRVGDRVYTPKNTLSRVTGVYPQGKRTKMRVIFEDNTHVCCDKEHLWSVLNSKTGEKKTITLNEIMHNNPNNFSIPISKPLDFKPEFDLVVEPYISGLYLGGGRIHRDSLIIDSFKSFSISFLKERLDTFLKEFYNIEIKEDSMEDKKIVIVQSKELIDIIKNSDIYERKEYNKSIPSNILTSSLSYRKLFRAGFLDTIDHIKLSSNDIVDDVVYKIVSKNKKLMKAYLQISRSLGFLTYYEFSNKGYSSMIIKESIKKFKKIKKIKYTNRKDEMICIKIADRSGLFITRDFNVTHNTTVTKSIVKRYIQNGRSNVIGCSLAGVAANRLATLTGIQSMTIHSLLKYTGGDSFLAPMSLDYSLIVVDECSMIDTALFYELISRIDFQKTSLLLIGDDAQLPPINKGQPFADIISAIRERFLDIPNTVLSQVQRSAGNIVKIANCIRSYDHKEIIDLLYNNDKNRILKKADEEIRYIGEEKSYIKSRIDTRYNLKDDNIEYDIFKNDTFGKIDTKDIFSEKVMFEKIKEIFDNFTLSGGTRGRYMDIQIISPTKRSNPYAVEPLNRALQEYIHKNDNQPYYEAGKNIYYIGDKVIHTKNVMFEQSVTDSDGNIIDSCKIYNGQIGLVENISDDNKLLSVYYPHTKQSVMYNQDDVLEFLELAFVLTAHKVQGNEFSELINIIPFKKTQIGRQYLYSSFTRAKHKLYILGKREYFDKALQTQVKKRDTQFYELLKSCKK